MEKKLPAIHETSETGVWCLGQEGCLEEEMTTHSSIAWKIPWTEEPGGLESMGSQRVRHDWATKQILYEDWIIAFVVQLLRPLRFFSTPWTAVSIESVMPSNHLICALFSFCLLSFPASGSFPVSRLFFFFFFLSQLFTAGGQSIGALASASVLPMIFRVDFL